MTILTYDIISSKLDTLLIVCSDKGIRFIKHFNNPAQAKEAANEMGLQRDAAKIAPIAKQITDYLNGSLQQWNVQLDLQGTDMQRKVWDELLKVPYGETISYTQLANSAGYNKAIRATGSACGKNPVPLIVPCHRIVAKDGSLGGFAWGLPVKEFLLELESATSHKQAA